MKKRIVVIFTGGTISMEIDEKLEAAVPSLSGNQILKRIAHIEDMADIEIDNYLSVPSPYITPDHMMELSKRVRHYIEDDTIDAVIVTHGTDTLEETSYFLDLNIRTEKPIIVVGSMRNVSELGYDGPSNLVAALRTAMTEQAKNRGVMVVMNDDINAANEVMKTHTMALDTFKSLEFGPLGIVDHGKVIFYRNSTHQSSYIPTDVIEHQVYLLKIASGMNGEMIDYCVQKGAKGIVLEALGQGNVPPQMIQSITHAIKNGVRVVLVSRCPMGRVSEGYGYEGGGKQLKERGVVFGHNLSGQKARIKLMLALGYTNDLDYIRSIFEME